MNIQQATRQIEGAVRAYLSKDEHGIYRIPTQMQRPIIMMGPPGIGKTAIVSQIADRLGVNFVSYSITHHTRQSALGLPYIAESEYGGRTYKVSRYTMSEIIAAAYDAIEKSGIPEGILFLDEVNCASETLMPAMLQFLQYKTFGQHRLPAGWVIVTAGNPPEYNRAAREFDPAMMDRLKRIDVEPDLDVWMDYAVSHGVHPAITTYLANKPKSFYRVRAGVNGARMVTARGWEDLSRMIVAYRHEGLAVDQDLVAQYLQDREVAEDFGLYLELFSKYEDDYKVDQILAGAAGEKILARATGAPFDERIALVNLLLDALLQRVHDAQSRGEALERAGREVDDATDELLGPQTAAQAAAERICTKAAQAAAYARAKGTADTSRQLVLAECAEALDSVRAEVGRWALGTAAGGSATALDAARSVLAARRDALASDLAEASSQLDHALDFLDAAFGADAQETVVFATHLAVDPAFMAFASAHASTKLAEHGRALMFHERGLDLLKQADRLEHS